MSTEEQAAQLRPGDYTMAEIRRGLELARKALPAPPDRSSFTLGRRVRDLAFGKGQGTVAGTQPAYGRAPATYVVWVDFDCGHSAGRYPQEIELL